MAAVGYIYSLRKQPTFCDATGQVSHEITSEGALTWISSDYFQAKGAFHLSELASRTSQLANKIRIF